MAAAPLAPRPFFYGTGPALLLDIVDFDDAAQCLGIVDIFDGGHVQHSFAGSESHVRRTETSGDVELVEELALWRQFQNFSASPLRDIDIALGVDLHAVGTQRPGLDPVWREKIQEREIGAMGKRAVAVDAELQDAVADRLADIERLLVGRNTDAVGVIEVVGNLDPALGARREVEDLADDRARYARAGPGTEYGGVGAIVGADHDVVDAADELRAVLVAVPAAQLFAGKIEFQDGARIVGAGEQERMVPGECQAVVTAARRAVEDGDPFSIPLRKRVGDPADKIEIAV